MPEWLRIGEDKKPKFFLKQTDLKKKDIQELMIPLIYSFLQLAELDPLALQQKFYSI